MTEPAKRLTPARRAYLLGDRRAKSRARAELRDMEHRCDKLEDDHAAGREHQAVDRDDEEGLD